MRCIVLFVAVIALFDISNAAPLRTDHLIPFGQAQKINSVHMMRRNEEEPDEDEGDEDVPPVKTTAPSTVGSPAAPGTAPTIPTTGAPAAGVPATGAPATAPNLAISNAPADSQTAPKSPLESLTGTTATISTASGGATQGISGITDGLAKNEGLTNIETAANDVTTVAASIAAANSVGSIAGSAASSPVDGIKSTTDAVTKDTAVGAILGQ